MYLIKKDKNKVYEKFHINITDNNINPLEKRNCWLIEVIHEGLKPLDQQEGSLDDLKTFILEDIRAGKNFNSMPYNNFECCVDWHQTEPK
jgi:hypothetical protein